MKRLMLLLALAGLLTVAGTGCSSMNKCNSGCSSCGPNCGPSGCGPSGCGPSGCGPHGCGPLAGKFNGCGPQGCGPHGCGPHGCNNGGCHQGLWGHRAEPAPMAVPVSYPYYTTRGPRDFLMRDPVSIDQY